MKWQKPSEELANFLRKSLKGTKCTERKLFGCPSYFVKNNMFIGAFKNDIFIRLPTEDLGEALEKFPELSRFEPRAGVVMKEYVSLPESIYKQKTVFSRLLRKSVSYARSLPPKTKSSQ